MTELPQKAARATADRFEIVEDEPYEIDGWTARVWRLRAYGVKLGDASLEGWFSKSDAPDPLIGRMRTKRAQAGQHVDPGTLAPLLEEARAGAGVAEILNIELEPVFFGQGLGLDLIRAALTDLPDDDVIAWEPKPTKFSNVSLEASSEAVDSFYRRMGFEHGLLIGHLTVSRADLAL